MKISPSPLEWRAVVGFPAYHVSALGNLRAVNRDAHQPKPRLHPKGFIRVALQEGLDENGEQGKSCFTPVYKELSVHRLVCEAFHGIPLQRRRVVHLDSDPTNNAASNLAWGAPVRSHGK